MMTARPNMS